MIQVNIRMTDTEKAKAEAEAERLGLTLSAYIRMLINASTVTVTHGKTKRS